MASATETGSSCDAVAARPLSNRRRARARTTGLTARRRARAALSRAATSHAAGVLAVRACNSRVKTREGRGVAARGTTRFLHTRCAGARLGGTTIGGRGAGVVLVPTRGPRQTAGARAAAPASVARARSMHDTRVPVAATHHRLTVPRHCFSQQCAAVVGQRGCWRARARLITRAPRGWDHESRPQRSVARSCPLDATRTHTPEGRKSQRRRKRERGSTHTAQPASGSPARSDLQGAARRAARASGAAAGAPPPPATHTAAAYA